MPQLFSPFDWIVFDNGNLLPQENTYNLLEKLTSMISIKKITLKGLSFNLPSSLKFVFEVNKVVDFSPRTFTSLRIIYIHSEPYSPEDEFKIWKRRLFSKQSYFGKYNEILNRLYMKLFKPCFLFLIKMAAERKVNLILI